MGLFSIVIFNIRLLTLWNLWKVVRLRQASQQTFICSKSTLAIKRCELCSKLTWKTPEQCLIYPPKNVKKPLGCKWRRSGVFYCYLSHFFLMILWLTLNRFSGLNGFFIKVEFAKNSLEKVTWAFLKFDGMLSRY